MREEAVKDGEKYWPGSKLRSKAGRKAMHRLIWNEKKAGKGESRAVSKYVKEMKGEVKWRNIVSEN